MTDITSGVDVDRPAADAFAVIADMSDNTSRQKGMKRGEWTSEPPMGVGSTCSQEATFLGRAHRGPGRFHAWAGPLLDRMVKRSVDGDYRRLRVLRETSEEDS